MLPPRRSARALGQLDATDTYVSAPDPIAAERLVSSVIEAAEALPRHPCPYRPGRVANTREAAVHPDGILIQRVELTGMRVLAVIHARRRHP